MGLVCLANTGVVVLAVVEDVNKNGSPSDAVHYFERDDISAPESNWNLLSSLTTENNT